MTAANFAAASEGAPTTEKNAEALAFAACTGGSSKIVGFAICDAETTGNVIAFGECTGEVSTTQTPADGLDRFGRDVHGCDARTSEQASGGLALLERHVHGRSLRSPLRGRAGLIRSERWHRFYEYGRRYSLGCAHRRTGLIRSGEWGFVYGYG